MNELDVYYRALLGYRKLTAEDSKCTALRSAIAGASVEGDKITVKTATCTIDEEWVNAIEKGLVHIEKAIKEERQFIRSNGEVVPIEKVKHVSKESVEHLAKHSSLITRYKEGEDIVPDKLYMVARLNDYAVYENRFLYMLLCYLRDFVTIRYDAILELTNKYDAKIEFDKKISTGKEKLTYKLEMHDVRRDDPYLRDHNPARAIIERIDLVLKAVIAFLGTPLMEEAGKAPMLKPPITKTNVLKMNNNFKGAMELYGYIIAYDKPGYTVEESEQVIAPFRDELADELAEAGGMVSFLVYEWGLGLKPELKATYAREEERRAAAKIQERAERIAAMKRRLKSGEVSIEDYVITLEKQLRALEGESVRAEALADEVERLKGVEKQQQLEIAALNDEVARLNQVIIDERQRHFEEMEALKRAHEEEIAALTEKYENQIAELTEKYEKQIADLTERYEREIAELTEKYEREIKELTERYEREIADLTERYESEIADLTEKYEREIDELKERHAEEIEDINVRHADELAAERSRHEAELSYVKDRHAEEVLELNTRINTMDERWLSKIEDINKAHDSTVESLTGKYTAEIGTLRESLDTTGSRLSESNKERDELIEKNRLLSARVKALAGTDKDLTDKDSFNELEREFNSFKKLYREQWEKTKRTIRKKHINLQNIKGLTEKDNNSD